MNHAQFEKRFRLHTGGEFLRGEVQSGSQVSVDQIIQRAVQVDIVLQALLVTDTVYL